MPYFEKKIYHDEVFLVCHDKLDQLNIDNLSNLKYMLKQSAKLVEGVEREFLVALNNDKKDQIINCLVKLIKRLINYFHTLLEPHSSRFVETFDYLYKILDLYDFEEYIWTETYVNFVQKIYPLAAPAVPRIRRLTPTNCFRIFYKIISCLVQDINNQEYEWRIIGDYYLEEYVVEIDKNNYSLSSRLAQSTPITFLSYAFVDNAYSYYLFTLFLENGGFLYVDGILGHPLKTGEEIKNHLNAWIKISTQFLFLRSVSSDKSGIKQWCSWEIGCSYNHCNSFYQIDIIQLKKSNNVILDDFKQFNNVCDGIIY